MVCAIAWWQKLILCKKCRYGLFPQHGSIVFCYLSDIAQYQKLSVYTGLPSQVEPSPAYPSLQVQVNPPAKLLQLASALHPALPVEHSSTSATVSTFQRLKNRPPLTFANSTTISEPIRIVLAQKIAT